MFLHVQRVMRAVLLLSITGFAIAAQVDEVFLHPCSSTALAATGRFSAFNQKQCRVAKAPLRTLDEQIGDTCGCETLLNVMHELKVPGPLTLQEIAPYRKKGCVSENFGDLFNAYGSHNGVLKGKVFGGFVGLIVNKAPAPSENAIHQITQAVGEGRVVAVALNAHPIYELYKQRLNSTNTILTYRMSHVVLVRAVLKNALGEITDVVLVDSSGPSRVYSVPIEVFKKAYNSIGVRASRGVYISDAIRAL